MLRRVIALAMAALLWAGEAPALEVVRVGGYEFPPFVDNARDGARGVTFDLIDTLNQVQDRYEFRFVPVAARRRYADLLAAQFDVMFFESPDWEWEKGGFPVDFTRVFLTGGEVYITQARPGRGQDYFASLADKRLVGILGYHYGFAGFEADPAALARRFTIKLVNNHRSGIDMVLAGRADVAVVTDSYLWTHLARHPDVRDRLLVSDRYDQTYRHRALVRRGGPIPVQDLDRLLEGLQQAGTLDTLWRQAGILR